VFRERRVLVIKHRPTPASGVVAGTLIWSGQSG